MIVEEADIGTAAEEGENYFVSMTDMMVGMLFIFIILLMTFALNFRKVTDVQENKVVIAEEVARKLAALQKQVDTQLAEIEAANIVRSQLLLEIQSRLQLAGLSVTIDDVNGVLRLTERAIRFEPNSAELDDQALRNVELISNVLAAVLPSYVACSVDIVPCKPKDGPVVETVFIEGHTDVTGVAAPDQRDRRNWQLSTERAVNTYRVLIETTPDLRKLLNRQKEEIVSVSGYSSTRPIDAGDGQEAWARNRRIDLRFVMDVDNAAELRHIRKLTDDMAVEIGRLMSGANRQAP
jgi:flagellar motor protein MotB